MTAEELHRWRVLRSIEIDPVLKWPRWYVRWFWFCVGAYRQTWHDLKSLVLDAWNALRREREAVNRAWRSIP